MQDMTEKNMIDFYNAHCKRNVERFNLIQIEWNDMNGFILNFIEIDIYSWNYAHSLFSLSISKDFFILELFFLKITIFDKTEK